MEKKDNMMRQVSNPTIVGENAHFLATTDEFVWKIIVTPEALQALARDRATPISSAALYADVLMRIADENLSRLDAILDEQVWVVKADVERWLGTQTSRWKTRRARDEAAGISVSHAGAPLTVALR